LYIKGISMQELLVLLQNSLHSLLVRTLQTLEETGRTVCDVTGTGPWECTMDLARQAWDTSRHVDIFLKLLERVGGCRGEYAEIMAETAPAGSADDALVQLIEVAHKIGDTDIERALEWVLADVNTRARKDQAYAVA
jgi:hypothetical protein